jgi:hypothetical protein
MQHLRSWAVLALASVSAATIRITVPAPQPPQISFAPGEKFTYTGHTELLGSMGRGEMWVEGPVELRGVQTFLLRFEFRAGIGPFGARERSSSWLDASRMASLRYEKHARRFLNSTDEEVDMFPDELRWTSAAGDSGASLSNQPLDELSFIYFIRTLPLEPGATFEFQRHFDAARNPTRVSVLGRDTIATRAGTFSTLRVQMVVKDARNYEKEGTIRFFISDDDRRIPVRIESVMPGVGLATLTLDSHNLAPRRGTM